MKRIAKETGGVRDDSNASFEAFWGPVSIELNYMNLEIRRIRYPYDNVRYMGIVNKVSTENRIDEIYIYIYIYML